MARRIKLKTPTGTYGLAVEPWCRGEIYAVAANWAQASAPVYFYGDDGWITRQYQVADFRHRPADALETEIRESMEECGEDEDDIEDQIEPILKKAQKIDDGKR